MRRITMGIGLLAIAVTTACDDDDGTGVILDQFQAQLSGAEEVPPVETEAAGLAEFFWDGTEVEFVVAATEPITGVTAAHIHEGEAGVNGGILVTLYPGPAVDLEAGEPLAEGSFTTTDEGVDLTIDELLDLMRLSDVYVNVHTEANLAGEIRGQVVLLE